MSPSQPSSDPSPQLSPFHSAVLDRAPAPLQRRDSASHSSQEHANSSSPGTPPSSQSIVATAPQTWTNGPLVSSQGPLGQLAASAVELDKQAVAPKADSLGARFGPYQVDTTVGQKRTASGHVKNGSGITPSPIARSARGHSRNLSATSQISDVSRRARKTSDQSLICRSSLPSCVLASPTLSSRSSTGGSKRQLTRSKHWPRSSSLPSHSPPPPNAFQGLLVQIC